MNFGIGISALQTSQFGINQVAQNLANANTEGYHRQEVGFQTRRPQFINGQFLGSGVEVGAVKRVRDRIVEAAYTNTIADLNEIEQRLSLETRIETFFLTGDGSIQNSVTGFFDELSRLSANPGEKSLRNSVVNQAVNLTQRIHEVSSGLTAMKNSVGLQIHLEVEALNRDIESLVDLEVRIQAASIHGVPNNLLDQRDQLVNSIAERVDVQRYESVRDNLGLGMAGSSISMGPAAFKFETVTLDDGSIQVQVEGAGHETKFGGGKIAALLDVHNHLVDEYSQKLETFTKQLIRDVDQAHAVGLGLGGSFTILHGARSAQDVDSALMDAELPFPVDSGELYFSITAPDGERRVHSISIDPETDSIQDVVGKISGLDNIQAVVDSQTGKISIIAEPGYMFDFTGRTDTVPDLSGFSGTTVPRIAGSYQGNTNQQYTVTAIGAGEIGKTPGLIAQVTDGNGSVLKELNIGEGYEAGSQLDLVDGITFSFGAGDIVAGDSFDATLVASPDTTGFLSAIGLNSFFQGNDAGEISVDSRIVENADRIATTFSGEIGDTRNLANLIALRDKHSLGDGRMTFNDFLAETNSEIGFRVQASMSIQTTVTELNFQYETQRDEVSGVDINEELVHLTQHQKSYEAAIQIVRTMEAMLDDLFQMIR